MLQLGHSDGPPANANHHHEVRTSRNSQTAVLLFRVAARNQVSHARSAAQRREQRRRAEARFAGRLCKLVEQCHRGFVLAHALVRAAAGCPQDASTQTQLEDLGDAEKEQLVGPTPEGVQLAAVVSALKQQCALTAEFCKSVAQEAVKAHIDDALSHVKSLEQVAQAGRRESRRGRVCTQATGCFDCRDKQKHCS